jgi:hypothetical protein
LIFFLSQIGIKFNRDGQLMGSLPWLTILFFVVNLVLSLTAKRVAGLGRVAPDWQNSSGCDYCRMMRV